VKSRLLYALFFMLAPGAAFGQEASAVQTVTFSVRVEHRSALSALKAQHGEKITRTIELPRGPEPSQAPSTLSGVSYAGKSSTGDDRTSVNVQKEPENNIRQGKQPRCVITVTE